ncbi:MAG: hypothetical protein NT178_11020 [Proteobacteria bacterium]|nr:hypothetical protein [Pseudomonadota bacterium]
MNYPAVTCGAIKAARKRRRSRNTQYIEETDDEANEDSALI